MKPESKTIEQSRAWAAGLCDTLERSARLWEFWEAAVEDSQGRALWQVYARWGCSPKALRRKCEEGRVFFMALDLQEVLKR